MMTSSGSRATVGSAGWPDAADATQEVYLRVVRSVLAFRGDSYQWMQVAELGFDNFMMRMRTRT